VCPTHAMAFLLAPDGRDGNRSNARAPSISESPARSLWLRSSRSWAFHRVPRPVSPIMRRGNVDASPRDSRNCSG
jgi:hypothetical protein